MTLAFGKLQHGREEQGATKFAVAFHRQPDRSADIHVRTGRQFLLRRGRGKRGWSFEGVRRTGIPDIHM